MNRYDLYVRGVVKKGIGRGVDKAVHQGTQNLE